MKHIKMPGLKFSRLLVIEKVESVRKYSPRFLCLCDCGTKKEIDGRHLRSGKTQSCGCKNQEIRGKSSITHGKTNTPEYRIWRGMRYRCLEEKCKEYKHYGGRGISICEQWLSSFQSFLNDMGPMPLGASIERIDNNGNYEPNNCKWADKKEQARNRRTNVYFEINGLKLTQLDWAKKVGISQQLIYTRLRRGWSVEEAINTKAGHPRNLQAPPL